MGLICYFDTQHPTNLPSGIFRRIDQRLNQDRSPTQLAWLFQNSLGSNRRLLIFLQHISMAHCGLVFTHRQKPRTCYPLLSLFMALVICRTPTLAGPVTSESTCSIIFLPSRDIWYSTLIIAGHVVTAAIFARRFTDLWDIRNLKTC